MALYGGAFVRDWTRFAPHPTGRMHLGHLWCAWVNFCAGDWRGIILRFEDTIAQNEAVEEPALASYIQDFRDQLQRFQITVYTEVFQSQREEVYREENLRCFGGKLTWDDPYSWSSRTQFWGPEIAGWNCWSSAMAQLTRVVDDHNWSIGQVIRGMELAWDTRDYARMWDILYPGQLYEHPAMCYLPEVCECEENGAPSEKISKSHQISRSFFLSDLELDPVGTLWRLADNQMHGTITSGPIWSATPRNLAVLRQWTLKAKFKAQPPPIPRPLLERYLEAV